jgi:hypothetical protein
MSGLKAFYGNYTHEAGEVYPRLIEAVPVLSDRGRRWATDFRLTVEGQFCADPRTPLTPATINSKITALDAAYQLDYKDFGFLMKSGDSWVPTAHYMRNDSDFNLSGNKVLRRSWVHREPTEFANTRTYNVTVGARFRESYSSLVEFKEMFEFRGNGGPEWVMRETWQGAPVRDNLTERTPVHVIQSGFKVTLDPFPLPNPPWFFDNAKGTRQSIIRFSPTSHGSNLPNRNTHYGVRWTYHFFLQAYEDFEPNYPWTYE